MSSVPATNTSCLNTITQSWNASVEKIRDLTGSKTLDKCLLLKDTESTAYKVFVIGITILTGIVTIPLLIMSYDGLVNICEFALSSLRQNQNSNAANGSRSDANQASSEAAHSASPRAARNSQATAASHKASPRNAEELETRMNADQEEEADEADTANNATENAAAAASAAKTTETETE